MKKLRMATPGPTQVPQEILLAGAQEIIHHRSKQMESMIIDINRELPTIFGTSQNVYTMLSSGTGAMEAAVSNCFKRGDKVLIISNGYFGERFVDISKMYGLDVIILTSPWGTSVDIEDVKRVYQLNQEIKGILVVYSETSTGAVNDVKAIGQFFQSTDVIVIIDAISGLISHELEMDSWGLDVVLAASHKGFMMPPGLSFVAISKKAWGLLANITPSTYYFSFKRYQKFYPMSPSSPGISLLFSLKKSIELLKEEGLSNCVMRHKLIAKATQNALKSLGFELFVKESHLMSNTVTTALAPSQINIVDLLDRLNEKYGLIITGGQGDFKEEMIRIGHVGTIDKMDIFGIFGAIEMVLAEIGLKFESGASFRALKEVFSKEVLEYA